jgi:phosphoglycerate dehydrogenase-like enzyme
MQTQALFLCNQPSNIDWVYGQGRRADLQSLAQFNSDIQTLTSFEAQLDLFRETQVIFSTWGMPKLLPEHLDRLPNLKAVFYAAGSVKGFAQELLARDILVMSSWAANAIPVAEFTLAQILLSTKGYFQNSLAYTHPTAELLKGRGNFGAMVALLGCGQIARKLIELMKPFQLNIAVVDPFLSEAEADSLGVKRISMEEAFSQAYVVSNHLPNLTELRGVIKEHHFESMPKNATFINTGRGAQVSEAEMISVFEMRKDLTALLDVTDPEPPIQNSPMYSLPNIRLSGHIAGSLGDEVVRMADYAISDFKRWLNHEPMQFAISPKMMATMA